LADQSDETRVTVAFWPKLKRSLARIPFAEDLVAAFYCATDSATPLKVRGTLMAALAYFVLPLDAIPDFILGLGFTDDMAVLITAITLVKSHMTEAHRDRARATLSRMAAEDADVTIV
jgi:uncharacterized membrane protein YkvA (DUF1232 family)